MHILSGAGALRERILCIGFNVFEAWLGEVLSKFMFYKRFIVYIFYLAKYKYFFLF